MDANGERSQLGFTRPRFSGSPFQQSRVSLFFAIHPPPAVVPRLSETRSVFRDRHGMYGRKIKNDCLHMTLAPVGSYTDKLATLACRLADTVSAPAFEIGFDHVASFGRAPGTKSPFVLGGDAGSLAGAQPLHLALTRALATAGIDLRYRFSPHVTLQYDEQVIEHAPVPRIAWMVREFVLIHSFVGYGEHEVIGTWKLGRPGGA